MSKHVKDLDLKAFHNAQAAQAELDMVSKHVKDLDLKAFHNRLCLAASLLMVSKHVKDLDLKAFHNVMDRVQNIPMGVKARQRS